MTARQPLAPVTGLKRTSRLPAPPPRTKRPDSPDSPTAEPTASPTTASPDAGVQGKERTTQQQRDADVDTIRAISLSLPLPLVEALKNRARAERITHAEVLMDAVTTQQPNLTELIADTKPHTQTDALFTRRQRQSKAPVYVALSLRMMAANVSALDVLTQQHNADSRSQFCAAALTGYLVE